MKTHLPLALALAALGAGACAPDQIVLGTKAWEGEMLEIWTTEDATVCRGSFEALDRHASLVEEYAQQRGISTRSEPYRYYWATAEELNGLVCGAEIEVGGCFSPLNDAVYTTIFHPHEVVHAEFASGHSKFIDEGLATMLGGSRFELIDDEPSVPFIFDETAGRNLAGERYSIASKFVRGAEELYPEEYLAPLLESSKSDDFDALSEKIGERLDIDAILELHEEKSSCWMDATRRALSECTMDPIPFEGTSWHTRGQVDCASEDALGPDFNKEVSVVRPFDLEQGGKYTVRSEGQAVVQLVSCENRFCESGFRSLIHGFDHGANSMLIVPNHDIPFEFRPGRHWFRISRTLDGPFEGTYNISLTPGWPPEFEDYE